MTYTVRNPFGIGGFGDHPELICRVGAPGSPRCTAMSKRNGRRCKMPPTKGFTVCMWHGANGGNGNIRLPTSKRNLMNKGIKRARLMAEAEVERRARQNELHPETSQAFR